MTEAATSHPAVTLHAEAVANTLCHQIHGMPLISTFHHTSQLSFVLIYFFTFNMPSKEKRKKAQGDSPTASRMGTRRKQVPASTTQALDETVVNEDLYCGSQAMDSNLDSMMNMLVDISS